MKKIISIVVFLVCFLLGIWLGYRAVVGPTEIKHNFFAKHITEKQFKEVIIGMSPEKIQDLLGKPKTINIKKFAEFRDEAWYYDMKLEKSITVKGGTVLSTIPVEITFKNGKVNNFGKAQF